MKTLYIAMLDDYGEAYEFIDNKFIRVDISQNDVDILKDLTDEENESNIGVLYNYRLSNDVKQRYDNVVISQNCDYWFVDLIQCKEDARIKTLQHYTDEELKEELLRRKENE